MRKRDYYCGACPGYFRAQARHPDNYPRCPRGHAKQNIWSSREACEEDWAWRTRARNSGGCTALRARSIAPSSRTGSGGGTATGAFVLFLFLGVAGQCIDQVDSGYGKSKSEKSTVTLTTDCLLRSKPTMASRDQLTIPKGATLDIERRHKGWRKVRYHGREGWVGRVCDKP